MTSRFPSPSEAGRVPMGLRGGILSGSALGGLMSSKNGMSSGGDDFEPSATEVQSSASQYFLLNSADRLQNASINPYNQLTTQAWNDFQLQKPAALMNAFASRIQICEVRFPWAIPNISTRNNSFYIYNVGTAISYQITITNGFYTPSELVAAINVALDAIFGAGVVVCAYDSANQTYSFDSVTITFAIGYVPFGDPENALDYYVNIPSLMKTMGFQLNQFGLPYGAAGTPVAGLTTNTTYTDYVDITSNRLMMNTDVQDGTSANVASKTSVVMRIFLADESSLTTVEPIGSRPFLIHRQFVTPKNTKWSPDQFIDYLDIQVNDMYGQLVVLPQYALPPGGTVVTGSYPDFQMVCLASEM
jgi:hypothetical protein